MKLGVNIDHVASIRQLRRAEVPQPILAATICESAGADSIVVHLREDRRHIQDSDVKLLRATVKTRLNLEMSINKQIVDIACRIKPDQATLVPEKRQELTTEGGLDVVRLAKKVESVVKRLHAADIVVSLFIEADQQQIKMAKQIGVEYIEIHTGHYADSKGRQRQIQLEKIKSAVSFATSLGLGVNAGHGLDYQNVIPICKIKDIIELNIGYSIICRAVFVGLKQAVREMKEIIRRHSI